jgi:hypothetical protein
MQKRSYIHFNTAHVIPHPKWCFQARLKIIKCLGKNNLQSAEKFKLKQKNEGDDSLHICNRWQHQLPKQRVNGYVQKHFKQGEGVGKPISVHIYIPLLSF